MGLQKYHEKRKFKQTPEPRGRKPSSSKAKRGKNSGWLRYYIQEHHASHLHYDFRLEMEGVLRSWAVPKGPSLDPQIKRLAVEVEDHPMEYGSFEGVIPENQYGAGHVVLWDEGRWKAEGNPVAAFKKGHIDFELKGEKLHGRWHLVRTRRSGSSTSAKPQWLLFKGTDKTTSDRGAASDLETEVLSKKEPLPKTLAPELAKLVERTPSGEEWSHEIKLDGYRILARIEGKKVRILTRSGLDWTEKFENIRAAVQKLGLKNTILDGEVVVFDEDGKSDFQLLQNAISENRGSEMRYCVFDLPFLNGNNLTEWPLSRRRAHLKTLVKRSNKVVRFSDAIQGEGTAFFKECCKAGLEGVISKRIDSPYIEGRGDDWVKSKCENRQEFVIGGWTDSIRPGEAFASLLLGVQEKDGLRYVGKTGTGFTAASMKSLLARFRKLAGKSSPFKTSPSQKGVHWLKPSLVAEVNFASWTGEGHLRQASFQGLREDKKAAQVVKETPAKNKKKISSKRKSSPHDITLTHPDRVLFKKAKITKQDLANYYETIQKKILPHIADRPLTIVRCPQGSGAQCFYQRHISPMKSPFVQETKIGKAHGGDTDRNYISIQDLNGIVSLVQLGTLEFHAWNTNIQDPAHPTEIIFDLDPGPNVDRGDIYECAIRLKKLLQKLKLKSFVNLSGSKGLHIHVPIAAKYEWESVKSFSHSIVKMMMESYPDQYTDNSRKVEREGRIFIDYLRNGFSSTSVVPYSVRNRPEATVAMPISWSDLKPDFDPMEFDIQKAITRIRRLKKDPWSGFSKLRQKISVLEK